MEKVYQITESTLLALLRNSYEYGAKYQRAAHSEWHGGNENELPTRNEYLNEVVSNLKEVEQVVGGMRRFQNLVPLVEALVYYSQISTVKNVIPAGMLRHDDAWRKAQQWLYDNCKIIDGEYRLEEYTAPVSVVGGIDWKGLEKEAKEYFPAAAKEYATKQGSHDKPHITAWDFVSGVDSVLSWLKTNLPKYYTAPVKEQVESKAEYEPAIMQSAFHFENGIRMICYSSYENGIKSFECNEDWQPFTRPFASCPFAWSGHKTMTEYHLKIRSLHKPELFVQEQSTKL